MLEFTMKIVSSSVTSVFHILPKTLILKSTSEHTLMLSLIRVMYVVRRLNGKILSVATRKFIQKNVLTNVKPVTLHLFKNVI